MSHKLKVIVSVSALFISLLAMYMLVNESIRYVRCDKYEYVPATEVPENCAEYLARRG